MKELQPDEKEREKQRKRCPLRRGGDRKCKLNGTLYCFPEEFTREDLQRIITECGKATSRGEYPNRKLVYRNSR